MKRHLTAVALLVCVLFVCALEPQTVLGATAGPTVAKYLQRDGGVDLEAMRASGYQGPLDLEGYDVRLDRRSGEPLLRRSGAGGAMENPDDAYWSEGFDIPGVGSPVMALTVYDNKLIAAGYFGAAGGVIASGIAAWDGSTWSPLGSGLEYGPYPAYTEVYALTVYDNKLIAGGFFTTAGGVETNRIAAWDGSTWSPLGSGVNSDVRALTVYDNKLIASGLFTTAGGVAANHIAAWDGSTWSPLGSGISDVSEAGVCALAVYDNKLIAGGSFFSTGSIAAWDGSAWSPLGSGVNSRVYALAVYDNKLIVGGDFSTAGDVEAGRIAAWDGAAWSPLWTGTVATVFALTVYDSKLIIGGPNVWSWDGYTRTMLMMPGRKYVLALVAYDNELVAGGQFKAISRVPADNIAAWDGSTWSALGPGGTNDWVYSFTWYDNKLILGGAFISAGGVDAKYVAAWDGSTWSALGSGMEYEPYTYNTAVYALTVYDNKLIAGGRFATAGGVAASRIAAWDGSAWWPLGSGMDSDVEALTVYDNKLIAAGRFTTAGGDTANRIAAWDGATWSPLGSGMDNSVEALTVYDNKLMAGGVFTTAGHVTANCVAAWDGSSWAPLGSGTGSSSIGNCVNALAIYNNELVAAGCFSEAYGGVADGIAAWDGSTWSPLGSGLSDYVDVLTVYDNKLIAGGWFLFAGDVQVNYIASWDGSAWSPLGSGMNLDVHALAVYDNTLMVGGCFTRAGDKASGYIAQWTKHTSTATLLQSFAASYQGSAIEIAWELSEQASNESFVIERAETPVERGGNPGDFVQLHSAEVTQNGLHYGLCDGDVKPGMTYRYRVALRSDVGSREVLFETEAIAIPALALTLFQNQPNPFNPSTKIRYYLPVDTEVTLGVYDAGGRLVANLAKKEKQPSGYHEVEWNGRDAAGKAVASGVYFCRLQAGKLTQSRKMIVLR